MVLDESLKAIENHWKCWPYFVIYCPTTLYYCTVNVAPLFTWTRESAKQFYFIWFFKTIFQLFTWTEDQNFRCYPCRTRTELHLQTVGKIFPKQRYHLKVFQNVYRNNFKKKFPDLHAQTSDFCEKELFMSLTSGETRSTWTTMPDFSRKTFSVNSVSFFRVASPKSEIFTFAESSINIFLVLVK